MLNIKENNSFRLVNLNTKNTTSSANINELQQNDMVIIRLDDSWTTNNFYQLALTDTPTANKWYPATYNGTSINGYANFTVGHASKWLIQHGYLGDGKDMSLSVEVQSHRDFVADNIYKIFDASDISDFNNQILEKNSNGEFIISAKMKLFLLQLV